MNFRLTVCTGITPLVNYCVSCRCSGLPFSLNRLAAFVTVPILMLCSARMQQGQSRR